MSIAVCVQSDMFTRPSTSCSDIMFTGASTGYSDMFTGASTGYSDMFTGASTGYSDMSDHISDNHIIQRKPVRTRHSQESSQIKMFVSKPPWPPLVVRGHIHAIFLPVMKFHGEYTSNRRNGVMLTVTVTFEATVKLAPAKPMCLLLTSHLLT